MAKAGLPDIVVQELSEGSGKSVGILIDLFGQAMAEGRAFDDKGDFRLDLRTIQNAELREPQVKSLKANATVHGMPDIEGGRWRRREPEKSPYRARFYTASSGWAR